MKKIGRQGRELVATDEPPVVTKSSFDAIVVEDSQSNGRFSDATGTNQRDGSQVLRKANDTLDEFFASKTSFRRWGRRFSEYARFKYRY